VTDAELQNAFAGIRLGVCRADCEREVREAVRNLRAALDTVTAESGGRLRELKLHCADANELAGKLYAERAAHAETRKALATVTAERDRLEHDADALSKYCLANAAVFVQNPNVCQVYSELQAKAWAIVSLSGRERIESERHQYVVKLDALREELDAERAAHDETRKALELLRDKMRQTKAAASGFTGLAHAELLAVGWVELWQMLEGEP
jgi:hypothetical protein